MATLILFALINKPFSWLQSLLISKSNHKPPIQHPNLKPPNPSLRTLFATFDADGDGYISTAELNDSLLRLGLRPTGDDRIDADGDGLIDIGEFGELYDSIGADGDRELREAFDVFDGNGDGLIAVEELGLVLRSMGLKEGDCVQDCREMIGRVDLDGDGMVDFHEFKRMMVGDAGGCFF